MKQRHLYIIFFLMTALGFAACNEKETVKKPDTFLDIKVMTDIMTDIQLIEGELNYRASQGETGNQRAKDYYSQLFEHYGISDSIFQANLTYYTLKQNLLLTVMDSVFARLNDKQMQEGNKTGKDNTPVLTP